MGKVEKLPTSRPLGPKSGSETPFNQGGPKKNKRVLGTAISTLRASSSDRLPASVKEFKTQEKEARTEVARHFDDLKGEVSVELVSVQGDMKEGEVIVIGSAEQAPLANLFPETTFDPYCLEIGKMAIAKSARSLSVSGDISLEELEELEAADDFAADGLMEFGATLIDHKEQEL